MSSYHPGSYNSIADYQRCDSQGGGADIGVAGSASEREEGEGKSVSEETTIVGELGPSGGVAATGDIEELEGFLVWVYRLGDGTSSVFVLSRRKPASEPADEDVTAFWSSDDLRAAGSVLACDMRNAECGDDDGCGDTALGVVELRSSPETKLRMLGALPGRASISLSSSSYWLYCLLVSMR